MGRFAPIVMPECGDRHRAKRVIAIGEIRSKLTAQLAIEFE
jgi:hypothetical protein